MLDLIQTMDEDIFVIDESGNLTSEGYIDVSRVYIRDLLDVSNNTRLGLAGGSTNVYGSLGVSGSVDFDYTLDVVGAVKIESVLNVIGISTLRNDVGISGNLDVSGTTILESVLRVSNDAYVTGNLDVSGGNINVNGNIYATGDVTAFYSNTSDERLKTNIETIENPLNIIANIRGVRFNWNDEAKEINEFVDLNKREIGVIAQEVEKELPEVIKEGFSGYKAVRYEKIIAVLIEGMKEQQSKINTLEGLVQNLIKK